MRTIYIWKIQIPKSNRNKRRFRFSKHLFNVWDSGLFHLFVVISKSQLQFLTLFVEREAEEVRRTIIFIVFCLLSAVCSFPQMPSRFLLFFAWPLMGNDHEIEFQEIISGIFQKVKRMIRRLKVSFFRR